MVQCLGQISRLKGFFRSGLNYSNYEQMLDITKRKASGSLPTDILSFVTSNCENKKSAVQDIEKILNEAVNILGNINTLERQRINRMPANTCTKKFLDYFIKGDIKGFFRADTLYKEKEIETIIKAEEKILEGMKKYIPDIHNVIITSLDTGTFANGYKLQILDKNKKQIFDDKILKVFRENSLITHVARKNIRFLNSLPD